MDRSHRLRSIDLNLLVVLDALLAEEHVTRAGKLVGLSQSATSNALERLRALFGDPILERIRGTMVPTPLAQALKPELAQALAGVARMVAPRADLSLLSQTIRCSMVDYGIALLAPRLLTALRHSAPGLDLIFAPWAGADAALLRVQDGALDLAVTVVAQGTTALRWARAYSQRMVVAMRRDHPARRALSFEKWLRYPHVVVSGRGQSSGSLDSVLASQGRTRRVGVVVPSFLAVPSLLADSDLMALVPEDLMVTGLYPRLITREAPVEIPPFDVGVAWHARRDHDMATMHVVRSIVEAGRGLRKAPRAKTQRGSRPP